MIPFLGILLKIALVIIVCNVVVIAIFGVSKIIKGIVWMMNSTFEKIFSFFRYLLVE